LIAKRKCFSFSVSRNPSQISPTFLLFLAPSDAKRRLLLPRVNLSDNWFQPTPCKIIGTKKNEKRGRSTEATPARSHYAGAGVSTDVKEHTAAFAVTLQARGVPLETLISALKETSYAPKERTLLRHMAAVKEGEAPLSADKKSGAPPILTDEQWAIVFGWVSVQEKIVVLETAMDGGQSGHQCVTRNDL
jgi:hypothetical protein